MDSQKTITYLINQSIENNNFDYLTIIKVCYERKYLDEPLYSVYFTAGLNKAIYWHSNLILKHYSYFGLNPKEAGVIFSDVFLIHSTNYIQQNSKKDISYQSSLADLSNKIYNCLDFGIILPDYFLNNPTVKQILEIDNHEDYIQINANNLGIFLRKQIPISNKEDSLTKI